MQSLEEVKRSLSASLSSQALFSLINTRIILRTGVDLGEIKQAENRNPDSVAKVVTALSAMGYQLKGKE
jgi:hypothetical protein